MRKTEFESLMQTVFSASTRRRRPPLTDYVLHHERRRLHVAHQLLVVVVERLQIVDDEPDQVDLVRVQQAADADVRRIVVVAVDVREKLKEERK